VPRDPSGHDHEVHLIPEHLPEPARQPAGLPHRALHRPPPRRGDHRGREPRGPGQLPQPPAEPVLPRLRRPPQRRRGDLLQRPTHLPLPRQVLLVPRDVPPRTLDLGLELRLRAQVHPVGDQPAEAGEHRRSGDGRPDQRPPPHEAPPEPARSARFPSAVARGEPSAAPPISGLRTPVSSWRSNRFSMSGPVLFRRYVSPSTNPLRKSHVTCASRTLPASPNRAAARLVHRPGYPRFTGSKLTCAEGCTLSEPLSSSSSTGPGSGSPS